MATRSSIAIKNDDGTVTAVYCHWDGYPENNGKILKDYYTNEQKVRTLLGHGDISGLGPLVGEQHPFDNPHKYGSEEYRAHDALYKGWTKFYGRDRGEKDIEARTFTDVKNWLEEYSQEYHYLFIDGTWYVNAYCEDDGTGLPVFDTVEFELERRAAEAA